MKTQDNQIFTVQGLRQAILLLMQTKNLTQLDIVRETGLCQSQISFFLREKRELRARAILQLQQFYLKHKDINI